MKLFATLLSQTTPAVLSKLARVDRTKDEPLAYGFVIEENAGEPNVPMSQVAGLSMTLTMALSLADQILAGHAAGAYAPPALRHMAHTIRRTVVPELSPPPADPSLYIPAAATSPCVCPAECSRANTEACPHP